MAVRRASTLSLDNSRGKAEQKLRKIKQRVKQISWLPEHLQRPERLATRRFPCANLSSCHIEDPLRHDDMPTLFKLPAEIRLKIYEYVIAKPGDLESRTFSFQQSSVYHSITAVPINCLWRIPGRLIAKPPTPSVISYGSNRLNLLLVSKRMYAETIDLFYILPTFVFCDTPVLADFMSLLLPQRLASIRHMHLQFLLRWPAITIWWQNDSGKEDNAHTWESLWTIVSQRMTGLRTLRLYIRQFSWSLDAPAVDSERRVLEPVKKLQGLSDFKLWYRHEHVRSTFGDDCTQIYTNEIRGTECTMPEAVDLRKSIIAAVLRKT